MSVDSLVQLCGEPIDQMIGQLAMERERLSAGHMAPADGPNSACIGALRNTAKAAPVRAVARGHEQCHGRSSQKTGCGEVQSGSPKSDRGVQILTKGLRVAEGVKMLLMREWFWRGGFLRKPMN